MTWFTAKQLAGLPGMPATEFRTREKLTRLAVPSRPRTGRGGGVEFDSAALPSETRKALMLEQVAQAAPMLPAVLHQQFQVPAAAPTAQHLPNAPVQRVPSDAERACADARLILVNQVLELARLNGLTRACQMLALQLMSGQCTSNLQDAARKANRKARTAAVGERTLFRWISLHAQGGWWALLPAAAAQTDLSAIEEDVAAVLGRYHSRDPQFRNLTDAAKHVTKAMGRHFDEWETLYDRTRRALKKVDNVALIKSRHSGSQRAALLPFRRRDTTVFSPLDCCVVDGHTFKAKVRHPDHGAPFAPEVTVVIDAATRRICGWSCSLSENTIAVGDAMRHAVGNVGVFAIVYSDNGAGETAKAFDCPVDGIIKRMGGDHRTGIPGNPQGRGLIERGWRTHMIKVARQFPTYQGGDVDDGTLRKVSAELAKEQRALRRADITGQVVQLSNKVPTWQQFLDAVEAGVTEYNAQHRHRSLPKNAAGKRMTPEEAWAASFDPALQHRMDPLELRMTFMPSVLRTAKRGEVVLFNQHYFAGELMGREVDGQMVSVRYDIHDPAIVMVYTTDGRFVCEAKWNANKSGYFPKPVIEMAREKRVRATVTRRQQQIDLAMRELQPMAEPAFVSLPEPSAPDVLVPMVEVVGSAIHLEPVASPEVVETAARRPFFDTPSDRYEWLVAHRADWTGEDMDWISQYVRGEDYRELADYYAGRGLAWEDSSDGRAFKGAR